MAQMNEANKAQKVTLCGTTMLNSASFMQDLHAAMKAQ